MGEALHITGVVLLGVLAALHWYLVPQIRRDIKPLKAVQYFLVTGGLTAMAIFFFIGLFVRWNPS